MTILIDILWITLLFNLIHFTYGLLFIPFNSFIYIFIPFIYYHILGLSLYYIHWLGHIKIDNKNCLFFWYRHHKILHHHYSGERFLFTPIYKCSNIYRFTDLVTYGGGGVICLFLLQCIFKLDTVHLLLIAFYFLNHVILLYYIHRKIHKLNPFFDKYRWFRSIKRLHYIHHEDHTKNLGIMDFSFDILLNSLDYSE